MKPDFDIIITGSGPAGVSAAQALLHSGLRILMVDGGKQSNIALPRQSFLETRANDTEQWTWMVGEQFQALRLQEQGSPKLRTPTHAHTFEDFSKTNHIETKNFTAIGSLATGGLSNAWGCGVSRFSQAELTEFPIDIAELDRSYEIVTKRIGVSGRHDDDLAEYFGLDAWAQPPIKMDDIHTNIYNQYIKRKAQFKKGDFRLGLSRVAALSRNHLGREACGHLNHCLWGCSRQSLYSAVTELSSLREDKNFYHESGFIVENIERKGGLWCIQGKNNSDESFRTISCSKLFLASGTLATTRFVLNTLKFPDALPLLSCPTAVFMLWWPRLLGAVKQSTFGLAQLSFTQHIKEGITGFGSTISTHGLPMSEFIKYLPLRRRYGIDLLKHVLSSCVVANLFLPGSLSCNRARVKQDGVLFVEGGYNQEVLGLMSLAKGKLQKAYKHLGAYILPMSFSVSTPGSDIHYAGTLPMRSKPTWGETNAWGEVCGLKGLYVVDGACLPMLSEKSHTLTIMANADRIARAIRCHGH